MKHRVLILAGNGRTGDKMHARHLIRIKDEPLIHRTVRLVAERGVEDIRVFADPSDTDYVIPPAVHEFPRHPMRDWVQEWEPSMHKWNWDGRTIILYGDCYFSEALLDAMINDPDPTWNVYARMEASERTGKPYGEMFGWVINAQSIALLTACQREVIRWKDKGMWDRALGWEVYRISQGHYPWDHYAGDHFINWDDASEDFDWVGDFTTWAERNPDLA